MNKKNAMIFLITHFSPFSIVQLRPEDKVSNKNFRIHTLLGTGAYGKVFLVEKLDGVDKGQLYAMKVLEKNKVTQKKKTTEHTRTEREVRHEIILIFKF